MRIAEMNDFNEGTILIIWSECNVAMDTGSGKNITAPYGPGEIVVNDRVPLPINLPGAVIQFLDSRFFLRCELKKKPYYHLS